MSTIYTYESNELYHYGVLGMKWGVRRKKAKQQYKKSTDKAFKEYERTINEIEKPYKRGQNLSAKDVKREAAAEKKYRDTVTKAKADYKKAKKQTSNDSEYKKERKRQNQHIATKRAIDVGSAFANKYLETHQTTWNSTGNPVRISSSAKAIVKRMLDYKYMKDTLK